MKKKDKDMRILTAAFDLFSEKGYNNTKIMDIAVKAGIGKGTIYEYYDSKEDIFIIAIVERLKSEFAIMPEQMKKHSSAIEKLKAFLTFEVNLLAKYGSDLSEFKARLHESNTDVSDRMKEAIGEIFSMEYTVMSDIIRSGIESGELRDVNVRLAANLAISAISSYCMLKYNLVPQHPYSGETSRFGEIDECEIDDIFDLLFNGIIK